MIIETFERVQKLLNGSPTRLREQYFIKNDIDLYNEINLIKIEVTFKEKLWYWVNGISVPYTCKCGNSTTFNKNWLDGYRKYCSTKCSQSDISTNEKRRITNIERYGVDNVAKSEAIKSKTASTNIERYGSISSFQNEKVREKWKNNLIEKYNVDHIFQLESVKKSIKNKKGKKTIIDRKLNTKKTHHTKTDEFKMNTKKANNIKYGVDWYLQTDEFKEKNKNTSLKKYGVDHYSKTDEFKEKVTITNLERYGVDNYSKTNECKYKTTNTNLIKYGVDNISKNEEFRCENFNNSKSEFYIKYIGNSISQYRCDMKKDHNFEIDIDNYIKRKNSTICTVCNPIGDNISLMEIQLYDYIKSTYVDEIICGYRDELDIDIYLPDLKIGFEFNGLYWHSELYKHKNYHIDKTNHFKNKGIRIIHIWEDDWIYKQEIIKSQISSLLSINRKIFARKCIVNEVSIEDTRKFLNENHIQGFVNSSIKIGLYHEGKLVSIMTFDKFEGRKRMIDNEWNLNRFCNLLNTNVIGGASKLLSYFMKNNNIKRIISYADIDWSIGSMYYKLGFNNIFESKPDYKYVVDGKRAHKSGYKKSKLNTDLTETLEMKKRNIYKIYDCGKIKFELK